MANTRTMPQAGQRLVQEGEPASDLIPHSPPCQAVQFRFSYSV
jgi:hypothetical protein